MINLGRKLWESGEPGFFEYKTEKILLTEFERAGFKIEKIPGPKGKREILRAVKP